MMSTRYALAVLACGTLVLTACSSTKQFSGTGFQPPSGAYRLIVMQPDISVGELTAGGMVEAREDWTNQARDNILAALAKQQAARGGETTIATTHEEMGGDPIAVRDLVWLHRAVGESIQTHKYGSLSLPSKRDRFDWTLGRAAVDYGDATGYNYALFLYARDSFSSAGRVALQVAGWLVCATGYCLYTEGGQQVAFASLVDLRTGDVVWFNVLTSEIGDMRTPEGADRVVEKLLEKMYPDEAKAAASESAS